MVIKALLLFAACGCLFGQNKTAEITTLMEAAQERGIFNGTVSVRFGSDMDYEGAFGYADASRTVRLSPDYTFYIGSISKEFNGASILLLSQQGKVRLSDKLSRYLSGYPAWADTIEVGQLLNYTSGLPAVHDGSESAVRQALSQVKTLAFTPGKAYLYSYANVYLQQKIVEKVAGIPYETFLSSQILGPCGVTVGSSVGTRKWAMPYTNSFKPVEFEPSANTDASFTAKDLRSWMGCLASRKVLNEASIGKLGQSFGSGESSLGSATFAGSALVVHQHQGSGYNYEALIFSEANENTEIVLLTNSQNFKLFALKDALLAILHGQPYVVPKKSIYLDIREGLAANFEQGLTQYMRLRREDRDKYDFDAEPMDLISTGKYLLRRDKFDQALAIFEFSTTFPLKPPDLSYAYELIAETWLKRGNKPLARLYYQKAIETDANNKNARGMLESPDLKPDQ